MAKRDADAASAEGGAGSAGAALMRQRSIVSALECADDLALLRHKRPQPAGASLLMKKPFVCAQLTNDRWGEAYADFLLGHVTHLRGNHQEGYVRMQRGLRLWRTIGDPHAIALGLNFFSRRHQLGALREAKGLRGRAASGREAQTSLEHRYVSALPGAGGALAER